MAEYFDLDVTLVRVLWLVITFFTAIFLGVIAYIVAWIVMPEEPEQVAVVHNTQQVPTP
jgi:phage shock protein PspC (stress-responsive transcriptional regulator)